MLYGPKSVHYRPRRGVTGVPCVWTSVRVGSVKQFSCISVSCAGSPEKPTADGASLAGSVHSSGVDAGWTSADAAQTSVAEIAGSHGQGVGELASLGLGGYSPSGLIQSALELLHVHAHLPWWLSIITATVALRILMFPLAVRMTTNAAKIANLQPETAAIMKRANDYKMAGNMQKRTEELVKLSGLYQKHGCNPLMMFAMPMLQIPVFVSFFFALRKMAAAPVASMTHGGAFWFTDLTVADPFFALPLIACLTFLTNVELGGESTGEPNPTYNKMKNFMRVSAILVLPISITFPSALFMYWCTTSVIQSGQILLLRNSHVRSVLGIPQLNKHRTLPPPQ